MYVQWAGVICKCLFLFLSSPKNAKKYIIFRVININIISWFLFCFLCGRLRVRALTLAYETRYVYLRGTLLYKFNINILTVRFSFWSSSTHSSLDSVRMIFFLYSGSDFFFWCGDSAVPPDRHCSFHVCVGSAHNTHADAPNGFFCFVFKIKKAFYTKYSRFVGDICILGILYASNRVHMYEK